MATSSERVEFTGSSGGLLAGRLDRPDGPATGYAVFAHCFTCSKDVHAASRIARALTRAGLAVLRFDFTGLGSSDGDFALTDFSSNVTDLVLAARHLAENHEAPTLLIGHSLGGAAVLAAAEQLPEVRAVATIGAPAGPEHVLDLLTSSREEIERLGVAEVCLAARTFTIRREFLDDLTDQPQAGRIRRLDAALLVLHSPVDETVGIDHARRIFDAARHPKSFVTVDGADHMLTAAPDAEYVAALIATWAARYLGAMAGGPAGSPAEEQTLAEGEVLVESDGTPFGQVVRAGAHTWRADEPTPLGADTGPSPYDLLLGGLGACTSMTIRMYAARKDWPVDGVAVTLTHGRTHVEDCDGCEERPAGLDLITRGVRLSGDLSDEQRARLLEIAEKCPVHRTLESKVIVETSLVT